VGLEKK